MNRGYKRLRFHQLTPLEQRARIERAASRDKDRQRSRDDAKFAMLADRRVWTSAIQLETGERIVLDEVEYTDTHNGTQYLISCVGNGDWQVRVRSRRESVLAPVITEWSAPTLQEAEERVRQAIQAHAKLRESV